MEQYITKKDLENWFNQMIKKYPNSPFGDNLISIKNAMFGDIFSNLNKIKWRER